MRASQPIPPHWGTIAADAVHNLHVALDYLWQRAVHGSKHIARDHFPAFESPECANTRFRGKEKGRLKTAVEILHTSGAFDVGNVFWSIRCFDDADKHDTTQLVAVALDRFAIDVGRQFGKPNMAVVNFKFGHFEAIEDGVVLVRVPRRQSVAEIEEDISFDIVFGGEGNLAGQPVLKTLYEFADALQVLSELFAAAQLLD